MANLQRVQLSLDSETIGRILAVAEWWHRTPEQTLATLVKRGLRDAECYRVCQICGCTEWDGCEDEDTGESCGWFADDLCTACAKKVTFTPQAFSKANAVAQQRERGA